MEDLPVITSRAGLLVRIGPDRRDWPPSEFRGGIPQCDAGACGTTEVAPPSEPVAMLALACGARVLALA